MQPETNDCSLLRPFKQQTVKYKISNHPYVYTLRLKLKEPCIRRLSKENVPFIGFML